MKKSINRMEKILRVGVIGMGMGKNHIRGFQMHPNAEVVAIVDINQAMAEPITII